MDIKIPDFKIHTDILRTRAGGEIIDWDFHENEMHKVHDLGHTGKGVNVTMLDSGLWWMHDDFKGQSYEVYSHVNDEGLDTIDHGTHCAGVFIAAHNGKGTRGWAPDCHLVSRKILSEQSGAIEPFYDALHDAIFVDMADIITMSVGYPSEDKVIKKLIGQGQSKGIMIFAAAGNDYQKRNGLDFPAAHPEVFAVGSYGRNGKESDFSDHGNWIDLYAGGEGSPSTITGNKIGWMDGTSMATPKEAAKWTCLLPSMKHKGIIMNHSTVSKYASHVCN